MDPQSTNVPSFELPTPHATTEQGAVQHAETKAPAVESSSERFQDQPTGGAPAPMSATSLAAASPQPLPPLPAQPSAHLPVASSTPSIADDSDLIEKAWVDKAKEIVAKTRQDPFVQNREMSRFKADYIKKRYNKDVKLAQEE